MSSQIDSSAALNYMGTLAASFQAKVRGGTKISEISLASIATPQKAFVRHPNAMVRAFHWVVKHLFHPKATLKVGETVIKVPLYDSQSNLTTMRVLFRAALRAESPPTILPLPSSEGRIGEIISFALSTDSLEEAKEGVEEENCHEILNSYLSERISHSVTMKDLLSILDGPLFQAEDEGGRRKNVSLIQRKIEKELIEEKEIDEVGAIYERIAPYLSPEGTKRVIERVASLLASFAQKKNDPVRIIDGYKESLPQLFKAGLPLTFDDLRPLVDELSHHWMRWSNQVGQSFQELDFTDQKATAEEISRQTSQLEGQFLSQNMMLEDLFSHCPEPLSSQLRGSALAAMAKAQLPLYRDISKTVSMVAQSVAESENAQELAVVEKFFQNLVANLHEFSEIPAKDPVVEREFSKIIRQFEMSLQDIRKRKEELAAELKKKEQALLAAPSQFSVQGGIYIHAPLAKGPITVTVPQSFVSGKPILTSYPEGGEKASEKRGEKIGKKRGEGVVATTTGGTPPPPYSPPSAVRAIAQKVGTVGTMALGGLGCAVVPATVALGAAALTGVALPTAIGTAGAMLVGAAAAPIINAAANGIVDWLPASELTKGKLKYVAKFATAASLLYLGYRVQSHIAATVASVYSVSESPQLALSQEKGVVEKGQDKLSEQRKVVPGEAAKTQAPIPAEAAEQEKVFGPPSKEEYEAQLPDFSKAPIVSESIVPQRGGTKVQAPLHSVFPVKQEPTKAEGPIGSARDLPKEEVLTPPSSPPSPPPETPKMASPSSAFGEAYIKATPEEQAYFRQAIGTGNEEPVTTPPTPIAEKTSEVLELISPQGSEEVNEPEIEEEWISPPMPPVEEAAGGGWSLWKATAGAINLVANAAFMAFALSYMYGGGTSYSAGPSTKTF